MRTHTLAHTETPVKVLLLLLHSTLSYALFKYHYTRCVWMCVDDVHVYIYVCMCVGACVCWCMYIICIFVRVRECVHMYSMCI